MLLCAQHVELDILTDLCCLIFYEHAMHTIESDFKVIITLICNIVYLAKVIIRMVSKLITVFNAISTYEQRYEAID